MAKEKDVLKDTVLNFKYPHEDESCYVFGEYIVRSQLCIFIIEEYENGVYKKRYEKGDCGGIIRSGLKLAQSFQKGLSVYEKLLSIWVFDKKVEKGRRIYHNGEPVYILKEINLIDTLFELKHLLYEEEREANYAVKYDMNEHELGCFPELKNFFGSYNYRKATKTPAIKINPDGVWFTYDYDHEPRAWIPLLHDRSPVANIHQRVTTSKRPEYGQVVLTQRRIGSSYSSR